MGLESLNFPLLIANFVGLWPLRAHFDKKKRRFKILQVKSCKIVAVWFTLVTTFELLNAPLMAYYHYRGWLAGKAIIQTGNVYDVLLACSILDAWLSFLCPLITVFYVKRYRKVLKLIDYADNSPYLSSGRNRLKSTAAGVKFRRAAAFSIGCLLVSQICRNN